MLKNTMRSEKREETQSDENTGINEIQMKIQMRPILNKTTRKQRFPNCQTSNKIKGLRLDNPKPLNANLETTTKSSLRTTALRDTIQQRRKRQTQKLGWIEITIDLQRCLKQWLCHLSLRKSLSEQNLMILPPENPLVAKSKILREWWEFYPKTRPQSLIKEEILESSSEKPWDLGTFGGGGLGSYLTKVTFEFGNVIIVFDLTREEEELEELEHDFFLSKAGSCKWMHLSSRTPGSLHLLLKC